MFLAQVPLSWSCLVQSSFSFIYEFVKRFRLVPCIFFLLSHLIPAVLKLLSILHVMVCKIIILLSSLLHWWHKGTLSFKEKSNLKLFSLRYEVPQYLCWIFMMLCLKFDLVAESTGRKSLGKIILKQFVLLCLSTKCTNAEVLLC